MGTVPQESPHLLVLTYIWEVPIGFLPRLKIANSVLPPMAARWKRAERAMRIIDETDEKITTWTKEPILKKDFGDMHIQPCVHIDWFSSMARQTSVYM